MSDNLKPGSPDGDGLRLVVDLNRCLGYAQCCFLAPNVFELRGEEALLYDPQPDAAELTSVKQAAASCPVQAITVETPDGGPPVRPADRGAAR